MEYKYYKLKDIGKVVTGKTPKTANSEFYNGDYMFITPSELHGEYFVSKSEKTLTECGMKSIKSNIIDGVSVMVGCIGWDMGNVAMCFEKCATNQQINSITEIKDFCNPYYLYYWLKTKKKYLFSLASTTRTPILSKGTFSNIEIPLPDRDVQDNIVKVLLSFDEKIHINNTINERLSRLGQSFYEYWFLQFDFPDENGKPYRSSGGKMKWDSTLKRDIPYDWECISISQLLERNTDVFDCSDVQPTIDLSVMPSSSISLNKLNKSNNFTTNLFLMQEGDLLFGSIRPYLKKAGIAPCSGVVVGTVYSYHVKKASNYNFALFTLSSNSMFNYATSVATGTRTPVVSSDDLLEYKVAYSDKIAAKFNAIISVKSEICQNIQENQKLTTDREWLVTLFMNGQAIIK